MAERLPFGEVRPQARPINSFIQPGRVDTAAATSPVLMGRPSGVTFQQQGSAGNVQGFNQYAQLADALAPFSRALMETTATGIQAYVSGQIQGGYYDELKNQQVRATLNLQNQQEQGAINAGTTISQLQKRDPEAAYVLNESNPWRLVGRRRALAQLAGGDISSALMTDLQVNEGQLAGMQPGDSRLLQRKQMVAQQVLSKYGLTGEEPEAQAYLVPKLNQAWDKYSERHRTLFSQQLKTSVMANGTAALGQMLAGFGQNGIPYNGQTVGPNDPWFPQLAGAFLTQELDRQLAMIGGVDRAEAVKQIREQLTGTYGQMPVLAQALSFVQGGNPGDSNRPTWGASNPLDLLELQNRGNGARLLQYEQGQKTIEQDLDGLWMSSGGPGSMLPTDPGYPAALLTFRNQAAQMGYRDVDSYMQNRIGSLESVTQDVYGPNPLDAADFLDEIENLPRSAFSSSAGIQELKARAREIYRADPEGYREALDAINQKAEKAGQTTPGLQQEIDRALLQDLNLPAIKPLVDKAKGGGGGSAFAAALQGNAGAVAAIGALGSAEIQAFSIRVNNLFLRNAEAKIDKWMAERPGVPLSSSARNVLINEAIAETRKSPEYAAAYEQLTKQKPGQVGQPAPGSQQGTAPGANVRGVPKASAAALPDSTVKGFAVRPVMDKPWIHQELSNINAGKPASPELYRMANRAGTSTNRMLLEQLRFYPDLDPDGSVKNYLIQEVKKQRAGNTVSSANYQGATRGMGMLPTSYNPLAPGSWLMNILMPPAAAATLPPSYSRHERGGGGGGGGAQPTGSVGAFRAAIIGKESGGNYSAVNPDSGALGIGQVMPENVAPWTQKYLGRRLTPQQFLRDSNAQDAVINGRFRDMLADQQKAGYSGEQAIRRAAAVWYSGQSKLWNDTRPQYSNGRRYPSIAEYTKAIWESYKRNGGEVGRQSTAKPESDLADQLVAQLSNERGYEDVAGLSLSGIVKKIEATVRPATKAVYSQFDKLFNSGKAKPATSSAPAPKDSNARIAAAAEAFKDQDTSAGPDGGRNACAWAINKVLKNAGMKVPWVEAGQESVYIPYIENSIRKGAGKQVTFKQARPGDLVIIDGEHMGIVTTKKSGGNNYMILSNSTSRSSFSYELPVMLEKFGATYYRLNPQGGR